MKLKFFILLLLSGTNLYAQFAPKWVVLEKQNSVGVIKPGANDIMFYMGAKMRTMNKAAFDDLNASISFKAGSVVLITGEANEDHIATDIEGRTLVIKGELTPAVQKEGSGVGYIKEEIKQDGVTLAQGMYVWLKSRNTKSNTVTVQYAGNKNITIPMDKVYLIEETTAEMAAGIPYKPVE